MRGYQSLRHGLRRATSLCVRRGFLTSKTAGEIACRFATMIKIGGGSKEKTTHLLSTILSIQDYYEQFEQVLLQFF